MSGVPRRLFDHVEQHAPHVVIDEVRARTRVVKFSLVDNQPGVRDGSVITGYPLLGRPSKLNELAVGARRTSAR